jgi:hypothetical protein
MRHAISLLRHAISPSLAQRVPDEGGNQSDEACNQYVPGVNERRGAVVSTRILGQELRAWKPLGCPHRSIRRCTQRHSEALRGTQRHSEALRGTQMALRRTQRQPDGHTFNVPIEAFGGAPVATEDTQALERRAERA